MSKLIEQETFTEYLKRFGAGKLDLSSPKAQAFLKQFAGAIIMLVPEASGFLVEQGMNDDTEVPYLVMAAFGSTLKEIGEANLNKIREEKGEEHENFDNVIGIGSRNKLCH